VFLRLPPPYQGLPLYQPSTGKEEAVPAARSSLQRQGATAKHRLETRRQRDAERLPTSHTETVASAACSNTSHLSPGAATGPKQGMERCLCRAQHSAGEGSCC